MFSSQENFPFFSVFLSYGCETCAIFTPCSGTEPATPALKGELLTMGPPGNP